MIQCDHYRDPQRQSGPEELDPEGGFQVEPELHVRRKWRKDRRISAQGIWADRVVQENSLDNSVLSVWSAVIKSLTLYCDAPRLDPLACEPRYCHCNSQCWRRNNRTSSVAMLSISSRTLPAWRYACSIWADCEFQDSKPRSAMGG